ncbi:MAG: fructose-specific PTS transporter subunit EIIC, partial [Leptotrichiaceae bacterium]
MRILDLLVKERINLNLQSSTKSDVIKEIAWSFEETKVLNHYDDFVTAVNAREALSSTALEEGIAIPHAKTSAIKKAAVAIGRKLDGIDYDSLDGEKSQLFFMIGAPDGANNEHIEVLAKLSQLLLDDDFRLALLKANSAEEVMSLIDRKETEKAEEAKNVVVNTDADYIVAVTACPTGIAHTYMAEEALKKAAKEMGVNIKVETNGTDGTKNLLTAEEIKKAKGVILAVDRNVETNRFSGKKVIKTGAKDGINNAKKLIQRVIDGDAPIFAGDGSNAEGSTVGETAKEGLGLYKHLMSGVSFMLPLVVSGGILIAFAFLADSLLGFAGAGAKYGSSSDLAKYFMTIGGAAFGLFVPILGGYIAYSIAERPGLTPGLVAGALAASGGSGFLGAMVGGFLAGYVVKLVIYLLKGMPKSLNGIKAILLYPVLSVLITGLAMLLILNPVVGGINNGLTNFLNSMSGSSKVLLGLIVGGMMAVDMGGPVNKAAYVFGVGT